MKEVWRPVPIYWLSKAFEISNIGNIRHAPLPIPHRNVQGYRQVTFKYRGGVLTIRVHRLVAGAFIRRPRAGEVVNHLNCNRSDNRVENLEWTTTKKNCEHTAKMGRTLRGLNHPHGKIDPEIAFEMYENGASLAQIGNKFGATKQAVTQLIKRARKSGIYSFIRQPRPD
jgi:hypothetical protein